jgi:hypothetical protein
MTGGVAAAGSLFFIGASPHAFALVEGLAAGAMLTMIAATMLPEAYLKGGSVIGLATLFGFLVAMYAKTLESPGARHDVHGAEAPAPVGETPPHEWPRRPTRDAPLFPLRND